MQWMQEETGPLQLLNMKSRNHGKEGQKNKLGPHSRGAYIRFLSYTCLCNE